jgi:hypothetical protein
MRNLPPPPDDVMHVQLGFDIDGTWATIGWWIFSPSLVSGNAPYLLAVLDAIILGPLEHVLQLMHSGATCTACRVSSFGLQPLTLVRSPGPNAGAWTGGQAAQVALGIHWLTGERGHRGMSITHLPAFPDAFTDDHASINQLAWGNVLASATDILADVAAIPGEAGGNCALGTVERSASGAPLASSRFVAFVGANPVSRVATIRRRISPNGRVSPV